MNEVHAWNMRYGELSAGKDRLGKEYESLANENSDLNLKVEELAVKVKNLEKRLSNAKSKSSRFQNLYESVTG
jgi:chromosome segregation ATPase